ncbi:RagB/SusD family nutrient uptake outer membrane protein [Pseudopedobacter sp.]|uniref:RagB/SusD family nutrient uptake outer membrane protein n=1 Tax=Pseudopedobacter sp. TaxID=1936787 RepID=UPI00333ED6AA
MKKILKSLNIIKRAPLYKRAFLGLSVVTVLSASGCSSFLDKEPTFVVKDNYYTNENDVNIGLTGIYSVLGNEDFYGSSLPYHLSMSDEGVWQRSNALTGPEVYIYDSSNQLVRNLWKYLYEGVERANVFLSKVDAAKMDEAKKTIAKGEAKFLRAYYYFVLTSNFGGVPLKKVPTYSVNDVNTPKASLNDLYSFITSEMEEAEGMVQPITAYGHSGRVTKSAVRGILARVYLKMAGAPLNGGRPYYEKAAEWAGKLVNPVNGDYQHKLVGDYKQLFKDMAAESVFNIDESIWEVEFAGNRSTDFEAGRHGNIAGIQFTSETIDSLGYSYGFILATRKLYEHYGANDTDQRRDWNIAPYAYNNTTGVSSARPELDNRFSAKFRRNYETLKPRHKNYTPINFPLLRFSDVLLMYAEAKNELDDVNEAGLKVKMVRDRAHAIDSTSAIGGDKDMMRQFIRNERFRELAFEGLRKFDLVRWNILENTMHGLASDIEANTPTARKYTAFGPKNVSSRNVLLPIPLDELSLNKAMSQNQGW